MPTLRLSTRARWTAIAAVVVLPLGLVSSVPQTNSASPARPNAHGVLIESATTETSETTANPDGSFTVVRHTRPVRVRQNGGWVPADPRLARRGDGAFAAKAALSSIVLSPGRRGAGIPLLSLGYGEVTTGLDWLGDLPDPVVSGTTATYRDVLPGVDIMIESEVDAAYQVFVIKTPEAARNPAVARLTLGLPVRGATVTKAADGSLHARDATGKDVFTAKAPMMWDSSGIDPAGTNFVRGPAAGGRTAPVATTVDGSTITLEPADGLLRDPAATYPLYVDPTWQPNYCEDCGRNHYLVQYGCGTSKTPGFTQWDNDDYLRAGFIADGLSGCAQHLVTARSFVQLNLGGLEGANIMTAQLVLAVASNMSCSGSNSVVLSGEIDAGMSFNHGPAWWVPFATVSGCPSNVDYDVRDLVMEQIADGSPTFTFGLISPNENDQKTWKRYNRDVGFAVTYNKAPNDPRNLQLFNGTKGYPCVSGPNRPVVGRTSTGYIAKANVSDPDGGMLYAGFRVYRGATSSGNYTWDGNEAGTDNVPSTNNSQNASATLSSAALNADGIYSFDVHATDGLETAWSEPCEIELELSAPVAPAVVSDTYPAGTWGGAPGQAGLFTFTVSGSPTTVKHYVWKLNNSANPSCDGTEPGSVLAQGLSGPGAASIAPPSKGTHVLSVWSCNRSGTPSGRRDYTFNVKDPTGPVASWQLEGNGTSAATGLRYAGQGLGNYGTGRLGQAISLSGQAGDYFATAGAVLNTGSSFSVSAWVNLTDLAGQRVVLSQDGKQASAFVLQYAKDLGRWTFSLAAADTAGAGAVSAVSSAVPAAGAWTHLTGVYDAAARTITVYVNGQSPATVAATAWSSGGSLVLGAGKANGGRVGLLAGRLDEVAVFDRALTAAQVAGLHGNNGVPAGLGAIREYTVDGGTADASGTDGALRLFGAAGYGQGYSDSAGQSATQNSVGQSAGQAVVLPGEGASAQTAGPVIDTSRSFTLSAWVKLVDTNGYYVIAGQDGVRSSGFQLRHSLDCHCWLMGMPSADVDGDGYRWAASATAPQAGVWTQLTGVYDSTASKILLYVNGVFDASVTIPAGSVFQATGGFTIGRTRTNGSPIGAFKGSIDQVQVWDRALPAAEIGSLANSAVLRANYQLSEGSPSNVPAAAAAWNLDETAGTTAVDGTGNGSDATLSGGASWTAAGKGGGALQLDGVSGAAQTSEATVDTGLGFSVSAWVKLFDTNGSYAIAGADGVRASGFVLRYGKDTNRWGMGIPTGDTDTGTYRWASSTSVPQAGVWTQLTGVYDSVSGRILLYVNGSLESQTPIPAGTAWSAAGPFTIGRSRAVGAAATFFKGAIDEVRVWGQALSARQAAALAGTALDGVTGAVGIPSGGVALTNEGGSNVAKFDSSRSGQILGPRPPNLRTDRSFTVEAWVKHTWTAQDVALAKQQDPSNTAGVDVEGRAAVGLEDTQFAPFILGYRGVKDSAGKWQGRWNWILNSPTGTVANPFAWSLVTAESSQDNVWTHLTGTYDAVAQTLCLYAATDTKQYAPSCLTGVTGWNGTSPLDELLIGRGVWTAQRAAYWYGTVRGVRVYSGVLDAQHITADMIVDHP